MKPLLCALALLATMAPIVAQPQDAPRKDADISYLQTVRTNEGWRITPVVLPEDNAAAMFDMRFWRFKVESVKEAVQGTYTLELRRHKQTPVTISTGEFDIGSNAEFTFGLMPVGDQPLWESEEIKVSTRFRMLDARPSINDDGAPSRHKNPIKEISSRITMNGYAGVGEVKPDGSIILTRFLVGKTPGDGENQLVLVMNSK